VGKQLMVMVDNTDGDMLAESGAPLRYIGRTMGDAPEVDSVVYFSSREELQPGQVVQVVPTSADMYDLYGEHITASGERA